MSRNNTLIKSRAPMRLGFAGGGSDLKVYSNKFGGAVLNATISIYVNCKIFEPPSTVPI